MSEKLILLLLIPVIFLHVFKIGTIPKGLHVDEVSIGVNAISIAKSGYDEYGVRYPLYFKALGEYKNPMYIYTTALIFKIFGVSEKTLRINSFIYFIIGYIALLILAKKLWTTSKITQAYFILSIGLLPQYFTTSRISYEVISQFSLISLTLLFVFLTFEQKLKGTHRIIFPIIGGLFLGLSVYTYTTGRLITFLLLISITIVYTSKRNLRKLVIYLTTALATCIPFIHYFCFYSENLTGRFKQISYLYDPNLTNVQIGIKFTRIYINYFLPSFQILHGDLNLRHHTGHGGVVFFSVYLLFILSFTLFLKSKLTKIPTQKFWFLICILLLISPAGAALTYESGMHSLRSFLLGLMITLLSAQGFYFIQNYLQGQTKTLITGIILFILFVEIISYQLNYFGDYAKESIEAFASYGLKDALVLADKQNTKKILVYILHEYHLPFYLETLQIPPGKVVIPMKTTLIPETDTCMIYPNNSSTRKELKQYDSSHPNYLSFKEDYWVVRLRCYTIFN